jgi:hypothetical protein
MLPLLYEAASALMGPVDDLGRARNHMRYRQLLRKRLFGSASAVSC